MMRGCLTIRMLGFVLLLTALSYLFSSASVPATTSTLVAELVQAATTPVSSPWPGSVPKESPTPDRISVFQGIASLKDEPRSIWLKTIGRSAESYPPDKHSAGRDTWTVGGLKMIVKWAKAEAGPLVDSIDIGSMAGASELTLAEAKQIVVYFGLSNSWITDPNEKTPWYIWHNVDGTPLASYGPESARLVDGRLVPENKNPALDIIIGHGNAVSRPGATQMLWSLFCVSEVAGQALRALALADSKVVQTRA
jgi:hypothetical protein